jgi:hypothetical protein
MIYGASRGRNQRFFAEERRRKAEEVAKGDDEDEEEDSANVETLNGVRRNSKAVCIVYFIYVYHSFQHCYK